MSEYPSYLIHYGIQGQKWGVRRFQMLINTNKEESMFEYPSYLIHYGIEGQKWGVRRFQNEDGTYTSEGLERRKQMLKDYDEGRLQGRHVRSEIRRLGRVGETHARYNQSLAAYQNKANRKFDKYSSKLEEQRSKGLTPSEKTVKKAIKYGTEVRKADYIAKDPQMHYDRMHKVEAVTRGVTTPAVLALGVPIGMATGMAAGSITTLVTNKKYNNYYKDVFEKARNETIADLKKRKLI